MNKITVVCHKDHSHGYEDFEGKCLLCVVDDLILEIGNLMIKKRVAEKREWVGLQEKEISLIWAKMGGREKVNGYDFAKIIESKLWEKNT
jgi:hypothetical protein